MFKFIQRFEQIKRAHNNRECFWSINVPVSIWFAIVFFTASVHAFETGITAGARTLYLQVGAGTFTGGSFNAGGTPGNNATVNVVSTTVPSASVGAGPQAMTTNSAVANSSLDNFPFCTVPAQMYVAGFYRNPGTAGVVSLSSISPTNLISGTDAIPFTAISWVSSGAGDPTGTIPSGTFNGANQTLYTTTQNRWFESCLSFVYANNTAVPAGTFTGRVTYTLSAP